MTNETYYKDSKTYSPKEVEAGFKMIWYDAHSGISVQKHNKKRFDYIVRYGKEVILCHGYAGAAHKLGECLMHFANCEQLQY